MEKEITDCWIDRYYSDCLALYSETPDIDKLRQEMSNYLESRELLTNEIPTYFHYWEDEDSRRVLWLLERDPTARDMLTRIDRAAKDIIDGKAALLKQVGDGSHLPVGNQPGDEAEMTSRLGENSFPNPVQR